MKKYILLIVLAAVICFISGCGPGQPFEIEEYFLSQSDPQIQVFLLK